MALNGAFYGYSLILLFGNWTPQRCQRMDTHKVFGGAALKG
jgi:hypothetical protein